MKQLSLRYPAEKVLPRVKELLAVIRDDDDFRAVPMSESRVMVMAMLEGLDILEKRYGITA
jgi:hypothetical protein